MSYHLEMPSCYCETIRKARKQHKCCECRKPIMRGDRYHYISGVWNKTPASYKMCLICQEMHIKMRDFMDDDIGIGCLREAFSDAQDSGASYQSWAEILGASVDEIKHVLGEGWFDE